MSTRWTPFAHLSVRQPDREDTFDTLMRASLFEAGSPQEMHMQIAVRLAVMAATAAIMAAASQATTWWLTTHTRMGRSGG